MDPLGLCKNVFHGTGSSTATQSILNRIDPKYLNPNSRFGRAFYVAENPETALSEIAHHGGDPTHGIRFRMNLDNAKVLDLTDPSIASKWGYKGGPISSATQAIGTQAQKAGINVIKYDLIRGIGNNYAVLNKFDKILIPEMTTPLP